MGGKAPGRGPRNRTRSLPKRTPTGGSYRTDRAKCRGVEAGVVSSEAIVESVDTYSTLCDFAELKQRKFLDGESFISVIEGMSDGKVAEYGQIRPVDM